MDTETAGSRGSCVTEDQDIGGSGVEAIVAGV